MKILRSLLIVVLFALVLPAIRGSISLSPVQETYGTSCVPVSGRTSIAWLHDLTMVARCNGYFVAQSVSNTVVFITSGTSYTVPSNFGTLVSIECLASGDAGATASGNSGAGGNGSYYAKITTLAGIRPGTAYTIAIGAPTWFDSSTTVEATTTAATGSLTYAGGAGAAGGTGGATDSGGGGGGSAGPAGAGSAGVIPTGGAADVYTWTATAGGTASPGAGGNGGSATGAAGLSGANYGGGGGGGGYDSSTSAAGAGGAGGAAIIVFTYTPNYWQPFGVW